jgi:hypothetical protein
MPGLQPYAGVSSFETDSPVSSADLKEIRKLFRTFSAFLLRNQKNRLFLVIEHISQKKLNCMNPLIYLKRNNSALHVYLN